MDSQPAIWAGLNGLRVFFFFASCLYYRFRERSVYIYVCADAREITSKDNVLCKIILRAPFFFKIVFKNFNYFYFFKLIFFVFKIF